MRVRCWGSRGSIPVSGPGFIKYGGDTTCIEIRSSGGDVIVVDAGSGIRNLGNRLLGEKVRTIHQIFTHVHYDHTIGFPFFAPVYSPKTRITVYGKSFSRKPFRSTLHGIIKAPYFPVDLDALPASLTFRDIGGSPFRIGPITVSSIPLNHPNGGLGFRFDEGKSSFIFLTDNELSDSRPGSLPPAAFAEFCRGADLLIHDAEFTGAEYRKFKGWGHSTYAEAVDLAVVAGVKRLGLFHINNRRTDAAMDALVGRARARAGRRKSALKCFGVGNRFSLDL